MTKLFDEFGNYIPKRPTGFFYCPYIPKKLNPWDNHPEPTEAMKVSIELIKKIKESTTEGNIKPIDSETANLLLSGQHLIVPLDFCKDCEPHTTDKPYSIKRICDDNYKWMFHYFLSSVFRITLDASLKCILGGYVVLGGKNIKNSFMMSNPSQFEGLILELSNDYIPANQRKIKYRSVKLVK